MRDLTPRQIVDELNKHIVGQADAKRAVAVAVRNRWRRQHLPPELAAEVAPKNILMIGPTGVGKTEIARRLAKLTGAPFVKVEASKFTEVGYVGRDVESMVRELVENAVLLVKQKQREKVQEEAQTRVEDRILDLLVPPPAGRYGFESTEGAQTPEQYGRSREKLREMLQAGALEERKVEVSLEQKAPPILMAGTGMEQMDPNMQQFLERLMPKNRVQREMTVADARKALLEEESENLLNQEQVQAEAVELAENMGIIFLDELDKVVASDGHHKGADVSREGVQRDLLPIVEGTVVQTRHGPVKTDHVLFIAAGAFHRSKPSDLMPELQGRFPTRVELTDLTKEDFVRILTEPSSSLTKQYAALLDTEGVQLTFQPDGVEALADYAFRVNQGTQNIGARRLYTIMERLLEELSFEAAEMSSAQVQVNAGYVRQRLEAISQDEDLSRFIL